MHAEYKERGRDVKGGIILAFWVGFGVTEAENSSLISLV